MVEHLAEMDAVFHALAHSARREMLGSLAGGERTVGELADPFEMSLAAASKHVKVLEEAGLLHRAVRGRRHLCRLAPERLAEASAWLRFYERFWSDRLGPGEDRGEVRQGWEEALGKLAADAGRPLPAKEGLERLEALIGRWTTEGETVPGPSGPATKIAGTDTYEWLGGGFFVVHRVDVRFGDEHVEAIEVIGYDAANGTYPTHAFDSQGSASTYRMRERDGTWTITGETERSTLVPGGDGASMRASWERSDDGRTWLPWMEIRLTRASEGEG